MMSPSTPPPKLEPYAMVKYQGATVFVVAVNGAYVSLVTQGLRRIYGVDRRDVQLMEPK